MDFTSFFIADVAVQGPPGLSHWRQFLGFNLSCSDELLDTESQFTFNRNPRVPEYIATASPKLWHSRVRFCHWQKAWEFWFCLTNRVDEQALSCTPCLPNSGISWEPWYPRPMDWSIPWVILPSLHQGSTPTQDHFVCRKNQKGRKDGEEGWFSRLFFKDMLVGSLMDFKAVSWGSQVRYRCILPRDGHVLPGTSVISHHFHS